MKRNYQTKKRLRYYSLLAFILIAVQGRAQLSGSYTIDSSAATGGTNYASWADFSADINTNGVSGPVTVRVMTDQLEPAVVFDTISGVSSTNTVTIKGNGKVLNVSAVGSVILLNGTDYFRFENLIVRNSLNNADVQGIRLMNGADYNIIKNSIIEFSALTLSSTSGGAYIVFSTSGTSCTASSTDNLGSYNLIDSNLMRTTNSNSPGPAFGIAVQGSSSTYTSIAQNNTISNNTIQNFYYYAIWNYFSNGNQILNNDISRANATSNNCNSTLYGIYSYYSYAADRPTVISGNVLHDWPYTGATVSSAPTTVYAVYTYYNYGNSSYRFLIGNNTIRNLRARTNMYLGYNYYNYYFDLLDNLADNADVTAGTSSSYNFYGWYNGYSYSSYRFNGNTIENCDGGYYWYGIRNYYPRSATGVQEINDNIIQNNKKSYYYCYRINSYYAQYSNQSYPISIARNIIRNNSHDYYYTYNIYTYYYGSYDITDNIISNNTSGYYYMYDIYSYYYGNYNIRRNKITGNDNTGGNAGYHYSIYNYYNYDVEITDNLIAGNSGYYYTYGIYAYSRNNGTYSGNIRQNTVKIDGGKSSYSSHTSYGIYVYLYYHPSVEVLGNIVDIEGNYRAYPAYTSASNANSIQWDANMYYVNNVSNISWYCPAGTATSFGAWKALGFAGSKEVYGDPKWNDASTYDLRSNSLLSQNNIVFNPLNATDANGVPRNTGKNDKGALENVLDIDQVANDFSPGPFECTGFIMAPTITLKNNFKDTITGFDMGVTVNGVLVGSTTVEAKIPVSATGTVKMNPFVLGESGPQVVKFFILDADDVPSNDTLSFSFFIKKAPGGGRLTLNSSMSAAKAHFDITGKPDVTTNGQAIVYDLSPPATVGYANSDHIQNGGSKWTATVSATTPWGVVVPGATVNPPSGTADAYVSFVPTLAFVDSIVNLCIKVSDFVSGCDTVYCRKVLVAPQGVPDFILPSLLCDRDEGFFENTSTVTSGHLLSTWDFGDGSPVSDATSPVYEYSGPGTYTITLTVVTVPYGYATSVSKTITVNEIPNTDFKISNACEGSAVRLTNTTTIGTGVLDYVWDFGDGSPTVTTVNATKTYAAPGGYKVTLSARGNGCTQTISRNVYQFARPVASFSKTAGICENDVFSFSNSSSISLGQYGSSWDFDDGGNLATVAEPHYDFVTPGNKSVKLKVISEFGCTDSMILPLLVKTAPSSDFTAPFACSRTATPFDNTTDLRNEVLGNYAWDFGDGTTSTATDPIHNWTTIGPKTVKLKTTLANGCSDEISRLLNVGVQPSVNFTVDDACSGEEVPFTNLTTYTQGDITYTWNFGDNISSNVGSPVHVYTVGAGLGTQTYVIKLKAGIAGGCEDSIVKTISVDPLPATCDFDLVRDYSVSLKGYKFTPKGGAMTGLQYTWLTGDGNSIRTNASGTVYGYRSEGKYCVTMIASNIAGCECSATRCVTLTTGLDDLAGIGGQVEIYPNPNKGKFRVVLDSETRGDMSVVVYNALGEIITAVQTDLDSAEIDLTGYAAGVYVVKVLSGGHQAVRKVTIE